LRSTPLTVLAIRQASAGLGLTPPEALRELLDDPEEAVLAGWGPITPLKPHLGTGFDAFVQRLQTAVAERYRLPAWTPAS
jgi:5'-nucleotidase